jgi:hypothetical protein
MKHLFEMDDDGRLVIAPQVLLVDEFKQLVAARKRKDALFAELSYIFFMVDMRSPYIRLSDGERESQVRNDLMGDIRGWEPDGITEKCLRKYKELSRTRSMDSLDSAWEAQRKLDNFLLTVDLNERNDKGAVVHDAKKVQEMLNRLPTTIKSLQETQRLVEFEIAESLALRGGREKAEFEDEDMNPD